jgi:polyhydroxyalkanoate synthesis regulator phasin
MFGIRRKAAITITAAIFGTALLGGAALAAFAPAQLETPLVPGLETTPSGQAGQPDRADNMKKILDALVAKNVITQAQEDAILAAMKGDRAGDALVRRVLAGLFDQTVTYLGTTAPNLKIALPGTSLGAIADKTPGKSKAVLVTTLTTYANGAIDRAVADGKITPDLATKAKATVPDHITKFVDHSYAAKQPHPVTPKAPRAEMFLGDASAAARTYLGLSAQDLATSLRSGKTLGEVADSTPGKTKTGLVATLVASANTKIDKAVADGKLTADQATTLKATVQNAITALVERKGQVKKSATR